MRIRKNKFGAVSTIVDGIRFASKREARRYGELRLCEKAKDITDLLLQVPFALTAWGGEVVGNYIADFTYRDRHGHLHIEDVKGHATELYKWKKRHMKAQYGIDVREV